MQILHSKQPQWPWSKYVCCTTIKSFLKCNSILSIAILFTSSILKCMKLRDLCHFKFTQHTAVSRKWVGDIKNKNVPLHSSLRKRHTSWQGANWLKIQRFWMESFWIETSKKGVFPILSCCWVQKSHNHPIWNLCVFANIIKSLPPAILSADYFLWYLTTKHVSVIGKKPKQGWALRL